MHSLEVSMILCGLSVKALICGFERRGDVLACVDAPTESCLNKSRNLSNVAESLL